MARVTKETLEMRVKDAEAQAHILQLGFVCSMGNEIDWIDRQKTKDNEAYKFGVARLSDSHGGLFFVRFDYPGQKSSFSVSYLDEVILQCKNNPSSDFTQVRSHALDLAMTKRYRATIG